MDAARSAIGKITGRTGHKTDVDESVNPSVTSQTIKPHRHEETTEAIDREVHQDHYHTTVQPISHREVLPEQHTHNLAPQVNREFRHGDEAETQRRVNTEIGQFQNTSTTHNTTHSTAAAPQVTGEHVHHHVHETVQPVIHKETYQPEVVHTTVPIHETHHEKATHHGMSALPMKSLDEFKQSGGVLSGNQSSATREEYDGAPRPYNDKLSTTIDKVLPGHHQHSGNTTGSNVGGVGGVGGVSGVGSNTRQNLGEDSYGSSGVGNTSRQNYGENTVGSSGLGNTSRQNYGENTLGSSGLGNTSGQNYGTNTHGSSGVSSGLGSTGRQNIGNEKFGEFGDSDRSNVGNTTSSTGGQYSTSDTSGSHQKSSKPSLMERLDPRVDSTGDGKAGFMK